jgi:hypothetical protein
MATERKCAFFLLLWGCVTIPGACNSDTNTTKNEVEDAGSDTGSDTTGSAGGCTREILGATVDRYFEALEAHDRSALTLSSEVKFTENGKKIEIGEGLWATAGDLKFKRSAFDVEACSSITESAVAEGDTDIIFGLRLKLEERKITEIETIVVRGSSDYVIYSPAGLIETANDDWETVLPADEQPTREELAAIVDTYYTPVPLGACGFAEECIRYEDGAPTGPCRNEAFCDDAGIEPETMSITPRLYVLDVEASIAVGVTLWPSILFGGLYTDFHMFKYRDGKVQGVHALFVAVEESGWE